MCYRCVGRLDRTGDGGDVPGARRAERSGGSGGPTKSAVWVFDELSVCIPWRTVPTFAPALLVSSRILLVSTSSWSRCLPSADGSKAKVYHPRYHPSPTN